MDIMARLIWSLLQENLISGFKIAAIINDIIRTGLKNELEASLVMKELDKKINEVLIRGGWKLNG